MCSCTLYDYSQVNPLTPTTARDRISVMDNKANLPKCPYCDFRSLDKKERKRHLKDKHYSLIAELAKKNKGDIEWAAGEAASFFIQDTPKPKA